MLTQDLQEEVSSFWVLKLIFIVVRDIRERGRELEGVLHQYQTFVKPSFEEYCSPVTKT